MSNRDVWAEIDLDAIEQNVREIAGRIKNGAKLCAVVKADAYGHGAPAAARAALRAGADYLAVAVLEEALELRRAGFTEPILILGVSPLRDSFELVEAEIEQAVCTMEAARSLSAAAVRQGKIAKIHLKVDTGMSRIGVSPEEVGSFAEALAALPNLKIEGIFSHFAASDSRDKSSAYAQLERFREALQNVEARGIEVPLRHIANSAAILEMPEAHFDMVRAGIVLYGLWPSEEVEQSVELRPAMCLKARVSFVKSLPTARAVSYGGIFRTMRDSRIATLPIGYADGYTRLLSGKGVAVIRGQRAPIVGRVCMDQCMVDVTEIAGVEEGDEAMLFGCDALTTDEVAALVGTIHYEIVCMVGKRVPRVYCRSSALSGASDSR